MNFEKIELIKDTIIFCVIIIRQFYNQIDEKKNPLFNKYLENIFFFVCENDSLIFLDTNK